MKVELEGTSGEGSVQVGNQTGWSCIGCWCVVLAAEGMLRSVLLLASMPLACLPEQPPTKLMISGTFGAGQELPPYSDQPV